MSKLWTKTSIGSAIFFRILASEEGWICAEWGWFGIWVIPPGSGSGLGREGPQAALGPRGRSWGQGNTACDQFSDVRPKIFNFSSQSAAQRL